MLKGEIENLRLFLESFGLSLQLAEFYRVGMKIAKWLIQNIAPGSDTEQKLSPKGFVGIRYWTLHSAKPEECPAA